MKEEKKIMREILIELQAIRRPSKGRLSSTQDYGPRGYDDACVSKKLIRPLTASEIRNYVHCPMLVYLQIVKGTRPKIIEPNIYMILGSFEHKCREEIVKKLRKLYEDFEKIEQMDVIILQQILRQTIEEVKLSFLQECPAFEITIEDYEKDLITRLWIEENQRIYQAIKLLENDITGFELVENLFPIKLEHEIIAHKIGLKGRIDQIFRNDSSFIPLDIKTSITTLNEKIDEETLLQLGVYCLLLEYETEKDIDLAEVYFSRILKTKSISITRELRLEILEIRDAILDMIESQKEPELQFEERKCKFCQFRDLCLQKISKGGEKNE